MWQRKKKKQVTTLQSQTSSQGTATAAPASWAEPYLFNALERAQSAFGTANRLPIDYGGAAKAIQAGFGPVPVAARIRAEAQPYYNRLVEQILPQTRSASIAQGAYDNPRGALTEAQLIRDAYSEPLARIVGAAVESEAARQRDYALRAPAALSTVSAAPFIPAATFADIVAGLASPYGTRTTSGTETGFRQQEEFTRGGLLGKIFQGLMSAASFGKNL